MASMDPDLVTSLTQDGPQFEANWATFLFNVDQAMYLKERRMKEEIKDDDIMNIVLAGQRYTGSGWSTGRASRRLHELSGIGVIKGTIQGYRDCWLYSLALLVELDLPQVELSAELGQAAFSLVGWIQHAEQHPEEQEAPVNLDDSSEEEDFKFAWDTPSVPCPKELLALWQRAKEGDRRVAVKDILEGLAPLEGLPQRPAENNLLPFHKKTQDQVYKVISQQILHVLRVWGHRYEKRVSLAVDMQMFQYLSEIYWKIQHERRDLSVPGSGKQQAGSGQEHLFTEEDVKIARQEQNLKNLGKKGDVSQPFFKMGGSISAPVEQSFLPVAGSSSSRQWRGPPKPFHSGKGDFFGRGGVGKGFKGAKGKGWKGGKGKGVPSPQPCHGDTRGQCQGGKISGQGGLFGSSRRARSSPAFASIQKVADLSSLVAGKCTPIRSTSNCPRRGTSLSAPKSAVQDTNQIFVRNSVGIRSGGGICKTGSSQKSVIAGHKVPSTLVFDLQNRVSKDKTSVDIRLSRNKSQSVPPSLQIRPLEGYISSAGAKDVGYKNRLAKCLFSSSTFPGSKTLGQNANRSASVPNGKCLLWAQQSTLSLDAGNECVF